MNPLGNLKNSKFLDVTLGRNNIFVLMKIFIIVDRNNDGQNRNKTNRDEY